MITELSNPYKSRLLERILRITINLIITNHLSLTKRFDLLNATYDSPFNTIEDSTRI